MPSEKKPPLVRRGFVIVLSLTMLVLYIAVAIPNHRRSMRGTKSTQILQDLRMLDAAVDQYVLEERNRRDQSLSIPSEDLAKLQFNSASAERGIIESTGEPKAVLMSSSKSSILPGADVIEMLRHSPVFGPLHKLRAQGWQPSSEHNSTPRVTVAPSSKTFISIIPPQTIQQVWESDFLTEILNKRQVLPNATESSK